MNNKPRVRLSSRATTAPMGLITVHILAFGPAAERLDGRHHVREIEAGTTAEGLAIALGLDDWLAMEWRWPSAGNGWSAMLCSKTVSNWPCSPRSQAVEAVSTRSLEANEHPPRFEQHGIHRRPRGPGHHRRVLCVLAHAVSEVANALGRSKGEFQKGCRKQHRFHERHKPSPTSKVAA